MSLTSPWTLPSEDQARPGQAPAGAGRGGHTPDGRACEGRCRPRRHGRFWWHQRVNLPAGPAALITDHSAGSRSSASRRCDSQPGGVSGRRLQATEVRWGGTSSWRWCALKPPRLPARAPTPWRLPRLTVPVRHRPARIGGGRAGFGSYTTSREPPSPLRSGGSGSARSYRRGTGTQMVTAGPFTT